MANKPTRADSDNSFFILIFQLYPPK
jgi:hypothetical protein